MRSKNVTPSIAYLIENLTDQIEPNTVSPSLAVYFS